jgi:hypothetical protein
MVVGCLAMEIRRFCCFGRLIAKRTDYAIQRRLTGRNIAAHDCFHVKIRRRRCTRELRCGRLAGGVTGLRSL